MERIREGYKEGREGTKMEREGKVRRRGEKEQEWKE